ncbi:MAG: molybdate ABC transporter substrate-binding protein [Pseudodesulfovibrio sp.]|jgi:molybdate transport system substrate-binding protein|uniref:Molybdate transport system substrate-binding protein n=1 Tax=Pseudodesulfovibrio indicus TaxID=1716143 RepID=A0A126QMW3_9BACT|nr:molybdate ABC transporter substrate-binding protein [Pseudodesulfovibrio indicus]AMK11302.1 molybdenum ABC transporter substrate-binding protein [Pseudodesulfovibrio indicus]TDT85550.1 molybdate transport system substrate-binding protein [Pseudodesulfovibrio indicus]
MKRIVSLVLAICLLIPNAALAADLFLAQAANFTPVLKEIIPLFEKATGFQVDATYASTGKLYGQIVNNAPYDILLAADEKRPDKLYADGLAEKPFVYAKGQVVLWSANKDFCGDDWKATVQNAAVKRVSIANTETAPYGTSSMKAMQAVGVWDTVQPKLVFGQSISQAFQFASTGAADAGFCAYSSVFTEEGKKGCFTVVDEAPPVVQAACILKSAPHPEAAKKFVEFLNTPEVQALKLKYGYK